ncbi:MAG: hypothetical protein AAF492_12475 [Verrucomicrobiota bacterium]
MKKNIVVMVLAGVALAGWGFGFVQKAEVKKLNDELALFEKKPAESNTEAPSPAPAPADSTPAPDRLAKKEYEERIQDLEIELAAARDELNTAKQAPPAGPSAPPMAELAKMVKNPAMKDMIRVQQKGAIDMMHADLYRYLELPEEDLEAFKKLLLDKQLAVLDLSMDMIDGELSVDEKKSLGAKIRAIEEDHQAIIKEFLGDEDYAVYKEFGDTQPERMQVAMFKGALSEPMTEDQEHRLIRAMYEERTQNPLSVNYSDQTNLDPNNFSDDAIKKYFDEYAVLEKRYEARAAEILSETQHKQFLNNLQQHRAMQEMGIKMASQMFGPKAGENK